jgi:NADH-quinone oxidoreductase subunit G
MDARPTWQILVSLIKVMGNKLKFNMAEEVFAEMSTSIEAFKGLDYDDVSELGVKIKTEISNKVKVS